VLLLDLKLFFDQYNTFEQIAAWVDELAETYPNLVSISTIGTSHQNRPMRVVKVTAGGTTKSKAVFFHGGIHAREWISPATTLWLLNHLVTGYSGNDPDIKRYVDTFEIYVLPVFNVDGYSYTWSNDRMWRKTRNPNTGTTCIGTDPNRNFGAGWGGPGSSNNPCSETYRGASAYSTKEVTVVTNWMTEINGGATGDKLKGYIDFHSYSQIWLSPYGFTGTYPPDFTEQDAVNRAAIAAIASLYGTRYTFGPIYHAIYPASGGSIDWAYEYLGAIHTYSPELRDTGNYGFLLPPAQIIPSGQETWLGLKVWLNACYNV